MKKGTKCVKRSYSCCFCSHPIPIAAATPLKGLDGEGRPGDVIYCCIDRDACSERRVSAGLSPLPSPSVAEELRESLFAIVKQASRRTSTSTWLR